MKGLLAGYVLDRFLDDNTIILFSFPLATLSHICKLLKKRNRSHFASNLATGGTVIHLEKDCSE